MNKRYCMYNLTYFSHITRTPPQVHLNIQKRSTNQKYSQLIYLQNSTSGMTHIKKPLIWLEICRMMWAERRLLSYRFIENAHTKKAKEYGSILKSLEWWTLREERSKLRSLQNDARRVRGEIQFRYVKWHT